MHNFILDAKLGSRKRAQHLKAGAPLWEYKPYFAIQVSNTCAQKWRLFKNHFLPLV